MPFAQLVLYIILTIKEQPSRLYLWFIKEKEACPVNFSWIINLIDRMIYILWVIWVSLHSCDTPIKAEACINTLTEDVHCILSQASFFHVLCGSPHHHLYLISYQTQALRVKGSYLLSLSSRRFSLCYCLHSRNHTHITSAKKYLLYLCVCTHAGDSVWACVVNSREWKEWNTFPEAVIKSQREDNALP